MNTNTTNTNKTFKAVLASLIAENKLIADKPIKVDGRQIIKSAANGEIYVLNTEKNKAFRYNADASECVVIPCGEFNRQVSLYKARLQQAMLDRHTAEVRAKEAERRAAYNEVGNINAPATATAIRLDAEREDSKFDYRRSEEIFSRSEAEAYEDLGGFFEDEEGIISLGHHKAIYLKSEVERARTYVGRDGQTYEQKAYLKMTFEVEGKEFTTRAYRMHFNSFKIQANQKFHGIFTYTKESQALKELEGQTFDIWVVYNDMIRELQADFYDKAAYAARKAEQTKAGVVRGSYGRPTENKATR